MSLLRPFGIAALAAMISVPASAGSVFASFDNFNYSGNITRYATLADAEAGTNAMSITAIATATNDTRSTLPNARDAQVFAGSGAPTAYTTTDFAYFSTAWYYTTMGATLGNGWGNPNNTNPGFLQYYDEAPIGATLSGGWSNAYQRFTLGMSGGNGDDFNNARLWPAPNSGSQAGTFLQFQFNLVADFATAAVFNASTGWYDTSAMPTAVTGGVTGIFQNDSTTAASNNGFYVFDLTLANGSWASANGAVWYDSSARSYSVSSLFAAPAAVPEPGTLALAALALAAVASTMVRRRGVGWH